MRSLFQDRRAARVAVASVACWLLLGWVWGDDLPTTILRALAATLSLFVVAALYLAQNPVARILRVALGVALAARCAQILGGSTEKTLGAAAACGLALLVGEYQIQKGLRRRRET